jgi:hypothetical protein
MAGTLLRIALTLMARLRNHNNPKALAAGDVSALSPTKLIAKYSNHISRIRIQAACP